jgi:hypothetical protein
MYDGLLVKKPHINAIQHRTSLEDGRQNQQWPGDQGLKQPRPLARSVLVCRGFTGHLILDRGLPGRTYVNGNEGACTSGRYHGGSSHAQGQENDEQSMIGTSAAQDLGSAPGAVGQLAAAGRPVRVGLKRGHGRGGVTCLGVGMTSIPTMSSGYGCRTWNWDHGPTWSWFAPVRELESLSRSRPSSQMYGVSGELRQGSGNHSLDTCAGLCML